MVVLRLLHPEMSQGLHGAGVADDTWISSPSVYFPSCFAVMRLPSS